MELKNLNEKLNNLTEVAVTAVVWVAVIATLLARVWETFRTFLVPLLRWSLEVLQDAPTPLTVEALASPSSPLPEAPTLRQRRKRRGR